MSEYLIDETLMTAMANQVRRINGTEDMYNGAQIVEELQKIQGVNGESTGAYTVQAMDYEGNVIKTNQLDSGMIFTLPIVSGTPDGYVTKWKTNASLYDNYLVVNNANVEAYSFYDTISGALEFVTNPQVTEVNLLTSWGATKIDWGDGIITTNTNQHTYQQSGQYRIKIYCENIILGHSSIGTKTNITINSILIPMNVLEIGDHAFRQYQSVEHITIPHNVASIGASAFRDCTSLTKLTLPASIATIGESAFEDCTSLTELTLSANVTTIGDEAFSDCTSLIDITLPEGLLSIGGAVFRNCTSLTELTLPASATTIGDRLCLYATNLETINIKANLTAIPSQICDGCSNLKNIIYPKTVTSIGTSAFRDCTSLVNITIPEGITHIGSSAFCDCSSVESITIPRSLTTIEGYYALRVGKSDKAIKLYISDLSAWCRINIFDSLSSVGSEAPVDLYLNNNHITDLIIPDDITTINYSIFEHFNFSNVTIPSGVTTICQYAFCGSSLQTITIPKTVTLIQQSAFAACNNLESAIYEGTAEEWAANVTVGINNENLTDVLVFTN